MMTETVPEFAVVGHPNEGKSSIVATLAEDDTVRVSPVPGETVACQVFPVVIDGREVIRFIDTPGFQNPGRTLQWMREHEAEGEPAKGFRDAHRDDPRFRDDRELLAPIAAGAGIIYVVDGSRPLRAVDRAEMEILRLSGRPRMAIINCKDEERGYLEEWKKELRKHFNAVRIFDAHRATYAERISLLESLKGIDQDWMRPLDTVISAFREDWRRRNSLAASIIRDMLGDCLRFSVERSLPEKGDAKEAEFRLREEYKRAVAEIEKDAHQEIRKLFKHNIFNCDLPPQSILHEELFSERTWKVLGLTRMQLIALAGLTGGAVGAVVDTALAGLTFGVFTALLGAAGAGLAALDKGKGLSRVRIAGMPLARPRLRVGPNQSVQFLYILLDRAFIFHSSIINWAHGRRDYPKARPTDLVKVEKVGVTAGWNDEARRISLEFFKALRGQDEEKREASRNALKRLIEGVLDEASKGRLHETG